MRYNVTVECTYVARYEVLVDESSEAMARIRAKQVAMLEEFEWSNCTGPVAHVIACDHEEAATCAS